MGFSVKGLNELNSKLNRIAKNAAVMHGTTEVRFDELFTRKFMQEHSKMQSFDGLLKAGGFVVHTKEDFKAIPDDEFDQHIANITDFDSWVEMQQQAMVEYLQRKLFS